MTWSFKKFLLMGLPAALILILTASVYWLLNTTSGAAWLWNQAKDVVAGAVVSSQVDGDLASGFIIRDLEYRSNTLDLSVARVEIEAGPGWWPVSIQIRALALRDVEIVTRTSTVQVEVQNGQVDIHSVLASMELPVPLTIHDAVLTNITLQEGTEAPLTLVESLRFQAVLDERLVVNRLDLLAPGIAANLRGQLALESPYEASAAVEGRFEMIGETGNADLVLPFKLECSGNLDRMQFNLSSQESGLRLGGELLELTISGSGSPTGIQIGSAALSGPGVDLGVSGKLDWSSQTEAGLSAKIRQLDLSPWLADWPAGEYLVGDFELNGSETGLEIPVGRLTVDGTGLVINIEADIDIETNSVNAQLDWSSFNWPLADSKPDFSSPDGKLNVSGSMDEWTTAGLVEVQLGNYPQGRFEVQGGGDRTSARLIILSGETLGGRVSGEAGADWAEGLSWDAKIRTQDVNPEPLLPGWPGSLDAEIEIDAQSQPERMQIEVVSLQGQLRGVPFSAHGGLDVTDDKLTFKRVELRTEEAVLRLNGVVTEPAGVAVKFSGRLPSVLLQGASGSLEIEGRYSSKLDFPLFDVQLEALDLAWNGFGVKGLSVNSVKTEAAGVVPAFRLKASGLTWQDVLLDEISLSLEPAGQQNRLKLSVIGQEIALIAAMSLAPENADDLFAGPWRGVFDELEVSINQTYSFELLESAPFEWSSAVALLGPVCLREKQGAGLCISSDYQSIGDWSMVADATAVPIDYLRDLFELDVHFEQLIEGHLEWHQPHDRAPTGGAQFSISSGRIVDLESNELLAKTDEGRLEFVLQNGNLESGVLDIVLPGTGFIDVDFEVLDLIEAGARKLRGRAVAQLDDIGLIGHLALPGVDEIDGVFESDIQLGGTLSDPEFDGGFRLLNGLIQYTPLGLKLEDVEIEGQVEKRDRGHLKGQFRAGEGIASVEGRFLFKDSENLQMELALSGDQLLLINTDTLKLNTETDLTFGLSPQRMEINGHIRVPSARLTPSNLLLGEVNDSEDLLIESRNVQLQPATGAATPKKRIVGQLEVSFGDDVLIQVPGVETNIRGSVMFNWSGDSVPLAEGSYQLQGKVDVYGPTLQINNGHISFPKVPADNPLLNIRAEREIFGNTQIRSAGVQVIGSLKRPVLEAYTVPVTNEDRAWALLITGSDFDQSQGVGGFDVGTYIAPKLYVSYGISLFEEENVISARYDLKKGFGVKVTSGQRETGLDVSYTIDR